MRYMIRLSLIVSVLVASLLSLAPAHAQPYFFRWSYAPSISCVDMGSFVRLTLSTGPTDWDLPPGSVITQATNLNGVESFSSFSWGPGTGSNVNGPSVVDVPGTYPVTVSLGFYTYVDGVLVYRSILTVSCSADTPAIMPTLVNEEITSGKPGPGTLPGSVIVPVPGPDMVSIPDTAVVGSFVTTTPAYFAPESDAATNIVLAAGKTLWVFGVDESGGFYKVMIAGKFFWVPVETMGPNFDEVWQGHSLPTNTVD